MKFRLFIYTAAIVFAGALSGCSDSKDAHDHDHDHDHAGHSHAKKDTGPAVLPADLFVATAPEGAISVSEGRKSAETGAEVSLVGYIGGRENPFTKDRAMFVLADVEAVPACTDHCTTPWDACCTANETITANIATVQVSDEIGRPLKLDLNGQGGLKPGAHVVVSGKVRVKEDTFLLFDAKSIHVTE